MGRFTVRVELIGIKGDDGVYDELHDEMKDGGFERIVVINSKRRHLPPGEYRCSSNDEVSEVADRAYKIANGVHTRGARVIATGDDGFWSINLLEVK
jgi:hypothetical protein